MKMKLRLNFEDRKVYLYFFKNFLKMNNYIIVLEILNLFLEDINCEFINKQLFRVKLI